MKIAETDREVLPDSVFLVGIKGVAMTALAVYLRERGVRVTGCDVTEEFPTDAVLREKGIPVHITDDFLSALPEALGASMIIYTGAHGGRENPLVRAAIARGKKVIPHGRALGYFMSGARRISVAGCHGKTTVSAMTATALVTSGIDSSYAVGCGTICPLGHPGHYGRDQWFVAEADEYATDPGHDRTPRFLWQKPEIAVITNIEFDHPDVYEDIASVRGAYQKFADSVMPGGLIIVSADDPECQKLELSAASESVGFRDGSTWKISDVVPGVRKTEARVAYGKESIPVTVRVPGLHNVVNAVFAMAASRRTGISLNRLTAGLSRYCGARRRMEYLGTVNGIGFIDDYAHHPSEIATTVRAVAEWYGKKVIVVFQPHTFSRTRSLLPRFTAAFSGCRAVILTDIYASAREKGQSDKLSEKLFRETAKIHPQVFRGENPARIADIIRSQATEGDVVVFMGAGDIFTWQKEVMNLIGKITV